jgi:filamentous hemagglutinin
MVSKTLGAQGSKDNLFYLGGRAVVIAAGIYASGAGVANGSKTGGKNIVYQSVDEAANVNYVGITNNLARRAAEQLKNKAISIDAIPGLSNLSRADARAAEQVLLESHGFGKNGTMLINKINSIAKTNPIYAEALRRGKELL